jgi:disulfide bond formation protein DsbB
MKQTSSQPNSSLGCFIQSGIGAVLLIAVFAFGFNVLAGAVNTVPEIGESEEAVAVAPTDVSTLEIEPTAIPPTVTPIPATPTLVPPTVVPTQPPTVVSTQPSTAEPTAAEVAQAEDTGSAAAGAYDPAVIAEGQTVYSSLCVACHGADARGLPNLGKDLVTSEFVHSLSDQELLDFIKTGRPIWDPANTTGIDMPPKGGNPALTDDQILSIIAYLRTLQPANPGS